MAAVLFPYGYTVPSGGGEQGMGALRSLSQLMNFATVRNMHPEFRRRVFGLMLFAADNGVSLGIGTAWRSYAQQADLHARNPGGSAAPGNSNHEGNNKNDDKDAIAADMVPSSGQAWQVSDPTILAQFGLIAFHISGDSRYWNKQGRSYSGKQENWHVQPWEVNYARSGRTSRANLMEWPIPSNYDINRVGLEGDINQPQPPVVDPNPPVIEQPPVVVGGVTEWKAYADARMAEQPPSCPEHTQVEGSVGQDVYLLQVILNNYAANGQIPGCGNPDGKFGPKTKASLAGLQTVYLATTGDGQYGPVTHLKLQQLSNGLWAMSQAPPPPDPLAQLQATAKARADAGQMPDHILVQGSEGIEVAVLQEVCNRFAASGSVRTAGTVDGKFGPGTKAALQDMQRVYLNTTADGEYGPVSHWNLQVLSNNLRAMGG